MSKMIITMGKNVFHDVEHNHNDFPLFYEFYSNLVYYDECESFVNTDDTVSLVIPYHMEANAMEVVAELREHHILFDAYSGCERIETTGKTGAVVMGEAGFIPRALLDTRQKCYLIKALADKLREVGGEDTLYEATSDALQDMEDANIPADEFAVEDICGLK